MFDKLNNYINIRKICAQRLSGASAFIPSMLLDGYNLESVYAERLFNGMEKAGHKILTPNMR